MTTDPDLLTSYESTSHTKLYSLAGSLADRIQINSGADACFSPEFIKGAHVPRTDWRGMDRHELKEVEIQSLEFFGSNVVTLVRMPEQVLEPFRSISHAIEKYNTTDVVRNIFGSGNYIRARVQMLAVLRAACPESESRILGHVYSRQGLKSTSMRDGKYLGLHYDLYGAAVPISGRVKNVRLCVNLSPEPRFLTVSSRTVGILEDLVPESISPDSAALETLARISNQPCFRIRIEPGEAYAAPTELVLHDGDTLGRKLIDATVTFIGHFTPGSLARISTPC